MISKIEQQTMRFHSKRTTYIKKEAVMTRPTDNIRTARVGYHASGTGLVMGFGA